MHHVPSPSAGEGGNGRQSAASRKIGRITDDSPDVTGLLQAWRNADDGALGRMVPVVRGVPGKVVAQLMGHANVDTTLKMYTQVLDGSGSRMLTALGGG